MSTWNTTDGALRGHVLHLEWPPRPPIEDIRAWVSKPTARRDPWATDTLAVHRAGGPKWPTDVLELVRALTPHWPGQRCPYHWFVLDDGQVFQALDLEDKGAHARVWNRRAEGIAVIGDFRVQAPTSAAVDALVGLLAWRCGVLGLEPHEAIRRHDELVGGSRYRSKACPGELLRLDAVARRARRRCSRTPSAADV